MEDQATIGLALIVARLLRSEKPLGADTILPIAELKLPGVQRSYENLITDWLDKGWIEGSSQVFRLTSDGSRFVNATADRYSLHALFYNEYYQAVQASQAHALFCQRVYGKNLGQHGMADLEQIHTLISALQVQPGQTLLDFGCGDGRISEYIAEVTGMSVTGVDIADQAIALAQERTQKKRERMQFICADIESTQTALPSVRFDRIIAIDSLFFTRDQSKALQTLLEYLAPDGKMGIFYHCPPGVAADHTALAQAASTLNLTCIVIDYSSQNAAHWCLKKQVLLALEPDFQAEGNTFLYKNRLAECDGLEDFHRYLYILTRKNQAPYPTADKHRKSRI